MVSVFPKSLLNGIFARRPAELRQARGEKWSTERRFLVHADSGLGDRIAHGPYCHKSGSLCQLFLLTKNCIKIFFCISFDALLVINVFRFFEFRFGINFFHFCLGRFEKVEEQQGERW